MIMPSSFANGGNWLHSFVHSSNCFHVGKLYLSKKLLNFPSKCNSLHQFQCKFSKQGGLLPWKTSPVVHVCRSVTTRLCLRIHTYVALWRVYIYIYFLCYVVLGPCPLWLVHAVVMYVMRVKQTCCGPIAGTRCASTCQSRPRCLSSCRRTSGRATRSKCVPPSSTSASMKMPPTLRPGKTWQRSQWGGGGRGEEGGRGRGIEGCECHTPVNRFVQSTGTYTGQKVCTKYRCITLKSTAGCRTQVNRLVQSTGA